MNQPTTVIERQSPPIATGQIDVKCTSTMTPTGARSLTTLTPRPVSRQRGLTIESAEDVREQQIRAQDAALAIREWSELALAARRAQNITPPDQVHGFVDRIMAGIPAWVMLDVDKPSRRTIEEYVSNIRDFLIYLALNDLSPAEVGPEDVKAFKMFLQSNGAIDEMERLRALWCGRAQRTLYRLDPRDVVMWLLTLAPAKARPNQGQGDRLKALLAVVGSFEIRPRAAYREIYSQDTVALKMTILRVFFNSAIARGALFANPASAVEVSRSKTSRETRIRSRMFSWDEIQALIASCDDALVNQPMDKVRACRDKCIVACGAVLGLRISEVVNLDVTDYDPTNGESGVLLLRAAKGGKDRVVDLTDKMRSVLDKWLNYRRLIKPASPAMFISLHHGSRPDVRQPHGRMDVRAVRMMFDERQEALGIKRPGRSFHGLRHRFATRALSKGGNLFRVSEQLGHSAIATTQIYVHVNEMERDNPSKLTDDVL